MKQTNRRQNGFALLVVIMVLLLVSFLAVQLTLSVRTELKIGTNTTSGTTGRFLAEGAVSKAVFRLIDTPKETAKKMEESLSEDDEDLFVEGREYTETMPGGEVKYYAANDSGKIDLNRCPRKLFDLFLEYNGLTEEERMTLLDSLEDWRDTNDMHRLNGAEKEYYEGLSDPYQPRNGLLEDVAELYLIKGADVLLDRVMRPYEAFTVKSKQNKINFNSLTPAMLDFMVQGDEDRKVAYYDAKKEKKKMLSVNEARQILGDDRLKTLQPFLSFSPGSCRYFTIVASAFTGEKPAGSEEEEAENKDLPTTALNVIVRLEGNRFKYVFWGKSES